MKESLPDSPPFPTLRQAMKELEDEKAVISFTGDTSTRGRPLNLYKLVPETEVFTMRESSDQEAEDKTLLRELIKETTDRYSTMPLETLLDFYSKTGFALLKENPVALFKRFGIWINEQHAEQIKLYLKAREKYEKDETNKHLELIQRLEKLASHVFNSLLGVPPSVRTTNGWEDGPYLVKYDFSKHVTKSNVDEQQLEKYLKASIFGNYVIEEISVEKLKLPFHIGGSDSSVQAVNLSHVVPWRTESREIQIITSVGTRYDVFKSVSSEVDWYPEPKVLAEYAREKAIKEGFLIPPAETLGYQEEMANRIQEAAMNLRQYHKDHEIMFEKQPLAKIHFRDGRVFPMEHRFADYIQPGLHGEIVRSALNMFKNIVNQIGASDGNVLYCGFVKRPVLDWLAPLVKWYMGFGSKSSSSPPIDKSMTLEDFLKFPHTDAYVSAFLFGALRTKTKSDKIFITFRTVRRFHNMQEARIATRNASTDVNEWLDLLQETARDRTLIPEDSGLDTYATLCARGAVMSFYTSLSPDYDPQYENTSSIPRLEIMIPFTDLESFPNYQRLEKKEKLYVQRILDVLFHQGILDRYPEELYHNKRGPKIFLVPKTVRDAHIASKSIASVFRTDFMDLLLREARIFWVQYRQGSVS